MDRRGFLKAILAAGVAPAIVSAANIMPVRSILMLDDLEEWKRTILAKATGLPTNPVERMDRYKYKNGILVGEDSFRMAIQDSTAQQLKQLELQRLAEGPATKEQLRRVFL